jgi:sugar phosphate isomerase/epimerase
MNNKLASALYPWSGPGDRFLRSGYREGLPVEQRIQRAAALGILDGVEMVYPFEVDEQSWRNVRRCLSDSGLTLAALGTTVSSQRQFSNGAFTSCDPATRRAAIEQVKAGLDLCHEMGGNRIYFFLGQDGCDYALEVDYADAWGWLVEGLTEVARHRSDIEICLEYKPFEPRRHIFLNDVGTALHLVNQIGAEHMRILLDTGHALMAGENLGESIWLLHQAGKLGHVHFNDNYRTFDDDMIAGSVHFMPFVEAMYWLKRVGYGNWISLDLFPYRESPDGAVVESIQFIKRLDALVDRIGLDAITALLHQSDGSASLRAIYKTLFGD